MNSVEVAGEVSPKQSPMLESFGCAAEKRLGLGSCSVFTLERLASALRVVTGRQYAASVPSRNGKTSAILSLTTADGVGVIAWGLGETPDAAAEDCIADYIRVCRDVRFSVPLTLQASSAEELEFKLAVTEGDAGD